MKKEASNSKHFISKEDIFDEKPRPIFKQYGNEVEKEKLPQAPIPEIRIPLTEYHFKELVAGRIIAIGNVRLCLADIGLNNMIRIINQELLKK